jgi:hypothetical protein
VLIDALRRLGLPNTALVNAPAGSIRLKLIKTGARICVSVRRVKIAMSSSHPRQAEFIAAFHALGAAVRAKHRPYEPANTKLQSLKFRGLCGHMKNLGSNSHWERAMSNRVSRGRVRSLPIHRSASTPISGRSDVPTPRSGAERLLRMA